MFDLNAKKYAVECVVKETLRGIKDYADCRAEMIGSIHRNSLINRIIISIYVLYFQAILVYAENTIICEYETFKNEIIVACFI